METKTKQLNKNPRAALYLRVSTSEQAKEDHYGIPIQEEKCKTYCGLFDFSYDETSIYKDEGISGALPVEERPSLNRLLQDARDGKVDVLVVKALDRLSRNLRILLNVIHELEGLDVKIVSVQEQINTTTAMGKSQLNMVGTFAQWERDTITERMQGGRKRAAQDGKWVWGSPPYGYRLKGEKKKKLIVYKEEAKWVQAFFSWLVDEKLSLTGIQKRANELKVPCYALRERRRKENVGYWQKSSIARILCNPIYTGSDEFYRYKRGKKRLSVLLGDETQQHDESQWVSFTTEQIVTKKQFELAKQQLLKNRNMASRNLKNVYLFNKLLYCGSCGLKMFAGNKPPKTPEQNIFRFYHGGRDPKWKSEHVVNNTRCRSCGDVGEARLESIWDTIEQLLTNPTYMMDKLKDYDISVPVAGAKSKLDELDKRLKAIQLRKKRISQVYEESNTMDYATFQKKVDECKRDEERVKNEVSLLNQKLLRKDEVKASGEHFENLFKELKTKVVSATYEEKSEVIHLLVDKIFIYKRKELAEVRLNVPVPAPTDMKNDHNYMETKEDLSTHRLGNVDTKNEGLSTYRPYGGDTKRGVENLLSTHRFDGVDAIYPYVFRVRFSDITEKRRRILRQNRKRIYKQRAEGLSDDPAILQNESLSTS